MKQIPSIFLPDKTIDQSQRYYLMEATPEASSLAPNLNPENLSVKLDTV
jgi:hypothetical protein